MSKHILVEAALALAEIEFILADWLLLEARLDRYSYERNENPLDFGVFIRRLKAIEAIRLATATTPEERRTLRHAKDVIHSTVVDLVRRHVAALPADPVFDTDGKAIIELSF